MPREDLTVQRVTRNGLDPVYAAANVDGHAISNDGHVILHVKNAGTAAQTVTVVTPRTVDGLDVADLAVPVPAGGERLFGPFPPGTFGRVADVDYSAVTSVTVAAFRH